MPSAVVKAVASKPALPRAISNSEKELKVTSAPFSPVIVPVIAASTEDALPDRALASEDALPEAVSNSANEL